MCVHRPKPQSKFVFKIFKFTYKIFIKSFGIFRLTDPPGLEIITNCQHPSAFHPHPENVPIYRELKGPDSHAQLNSDLHLEVIDLRK